MASLTTRALISVFTIYVSLIKYSSLAASDSPTSAALESLITSAARIEDRDVNSVCGFWLTNGETWSWFCEVGIPCMIDTYVAPNLVFCSSPGLIPFTTYYPYGSWPAGGCSLQEKCCPQTQAYPREHIFDSGATIWCACEPESEAINVTTQLGVYSVDLAIYTSSAITSASKKSLFVTITASASGSEPSISSSGVSTSLSEGANLTTGNPPTSSISGGVIAGIVIGILVAIGIIAGLGLLAFISIRRQRRRRDRQPDPANLNPISTASMPSTTLGTPLTQANIAAISRRSEVLPGESASQVNVPDPALSQGSPPIHHSDAGLDMTSQEHSSLSPLHPRRQDPIGPAASRYQNTPSVMSSGSAFGSMPPVHAPSVTSYQPPHK